MVRAEEISGLEATPSLVIDRTIVGKNLDRMQKYVAEHGLRLRPHTKTHKSINIAKEQIAGGSTGLTAAKIGEAEVMAQASNDLLIAYPIIDSTRCQRLALLAQRGIQVRTTADSVYGIEALASAARQAQTTIGVLVDLDIGFHRTGVASAEDGLALAQRIAQNSSLRLDGIFFYPGHVWDRADSQQPVLEKIDAILEESVDLWRRSGLAVDIVSGGSTPTAFQSHFMRRITEIRPGTYPYNDMNTVRAGYCTLEDCAAFVVCTVVSNAVSGKVVIDAGSKTLTSDRNVTQPDSGHGHVVEFPDAKIIRLSEEHGEIDVSRCQRPPKLGERISVIPNHICPCVNLREHFWYRDDQGRIDKILIEARGKLT